MKFSHLIVEALPGGGCSVSTVTQEAAEAYTGDGVAILITDAPAGDPLDWTLNPGDTLPTYDAAAQAAAQARHENEVVGKLRAAALQRQSAVGFDYNFSILLGLAEMKTASASAAVEPKAQACIDAVAEIWAEYDVRKAAFTENYNFSGYGSKPYSYDEVETEFKGA